MRHIASHSDVHARNVNIFAIIFLFSVSGDETRLPFSVPERRRREMQRLCVAADEDEDAPSLIRGMPTDAGVPAAALPRRSERHSRRGFSRTPSAATSFSMIETSRQPSSTLTLSTTVDHCQRTTPGHIRFVVQRFTIFADVDLQHTQAGEAPSSFFLERDAQPARRHE